MNNASTIFAFLFAGLLGEPAHGAPLPRGMDAFLNQHCLDCHDSAISKADLNLADLTFQPADPANFQLWQRVYERVRDGEMPPAKKPQPAPSEAERFLRALKTPLLEADAADIAKNGRVRSRRLTRREYEHTMHDLLGIDIPLQDKLPDDPQSHGFETVADGQQLSHHQLARYLDVADLALNAAFRRALKGDVEWKRECTPRELARRAGGNYRGPDLRDGKSISWPISLQFFGRMYATQVPADGWYRITLKDVHAVNPGPDDAVWGTLRSGACNSSAPILYLIGLVEATESPRDLVYEAWIRDDHRLELKPNDFTLKRARTGASGGNVSFKGRDLEAQGYSGIAHRGIIIERIHPNADRVTVRRNLFGDVSEEQAREKPKETVHKLVGRFARRAFRRPMTDRQLEPYRKIALDSLADGDSAAESLRAAYRAILCSPRFLTLIEKPGQLDDYALASRLSYALWVGMPDWKLTKLAADGRLSDPQVLDQQIDRMLNDRKFERFIASYTDQWLKLKEIDFTSPDSRRFRSFDPVVQESMVQETRAYVRDMIRSDLSVANLVDSRFAFLNGRLARYYDIDAAVTPGKGLQKVSLPKLEKIRGGLVTHGSILKVTADGSISSPVVRGVFVNERILGAKVPPPPPGVPAIEPDIRGATSIRDQLDKHRDNESCFACHKLIDPPGLALENFDPAGQWRTRYGRGRGAHVNPAGVTPEGDPFTNIAQWKAIYARREAQLARGFAEHFLTYATGAAMRFSDHAELEKIISRAEKKNYGAGSIIRAALHSSIFQRK